MSKGNEFCEILYLVWYEGEWEEDVREEQYFEFKELGEWVYIFQKYYEVCKEEFKIKKCQKGEENYWEGFEDNYSVERDFKQKDVKEKNDEYEY